MMRRQLVGYFWVGLVSMLSLLAAPSAVLASGGAAVPFEFTPNQGNEASLQRGAKLFMNYCSGCHTLQYMRYQRISEDLNIPTEKMEKNLMFTRGIIHDQITGTMPEKSADWFGTMPPDLTLVARWHPNGADWLYSFLLSFYLDDKTGTGVNNLVMENTAMPHVLWPLQGYQKLPESDGDHGEEAGGHGAAKPEFEIVQAGSMDEQEYRRAVGDIVNFLVYVGEPAKMVRYSLGKKVIAFLLLFTLLAWLLKREYWRDVH